MPESTGIESATNVASTAAWVASAVLVVVRSRMMLSLGLLAGAFALAVEAVAAGVLAEVDELLGGGAVARRGDLPR